MLIRVGFVELLDDKEMLDNVGSLVKITREGYKARSRSFSFSDASTPAICGGDPGTDVGGEDDKGRLGTDCVGDGACASDKGWIDGVSLPATEAVPDGRCGGDPGVRRAST